MLKVHAYCSYKLSPSGYNYGTFSRGDASDEFYELSSEGKSEIVAKAFETNYISKLSGKIPDSCNYIFLIRKYKHSYDNHDDFGKTVYINIAFEFDIYNEYNRFIASFGDVEYGCMCERLADFIVPDSSVSLFALKINKARFDKFMEEMLVSDPIKDVNKECIEITTISSSVDYHNKICDLFSFDADRLSRGYGGSYVYTEKKAAQKKQYSQKPHQSQESSYRYKDIGNITANNDGISWVKRHKSIFKDAAIVLAGAAGGAAAVVAVIKLIEIMQ